MYAGFRYCSGDYVAVMDADLQHPPAVFPQMLAAMEEGYDCCATKRAERKGESFFRGFFSKLVAVFLNFLIYKGSDPEGDVSAGKLFCKLAR